MVGRLSLHRGDRNEYVDGDRNSGVGKAHGDAASHGSATDHASRVDGFDGCVFGHVWNLRDFALAEEHMNQRFALWLSQALL